MSIAVDIDGGGALIRAASSSSISDATLARIDRCFGLDDVRVLRYDDRKRSTGRRMRIADGRLAAVRLAGNLQGEAWLREWLTDGRDVAALGAALLVPSAAPPRGERLRGRVVCNCLDVSESQITTRIATLAADVRSPLRALQDDLGCGTQCGSCIPEIISLISAHRVPA